MLKAIVFDFDGTLTKKGTNVWKKIWSSLGYDTDEQSYYKQLFHKFFQGEITHNDWCDLTCEKFKEKNFSMKDLIEIADKVELLKNVKESIKWLYEHGFHLHIVSGNILPVIYRVMGDTIKYFESINANDMFFDNNGIINKIVGTKYDFEGKSRFVKNYTQISGISIAEILFVGNGENDKWVYQSGCKTLCINPDEEARAEDRKIWHKAVNQIEDFSELIEFIKQM